MAEVERVVSSGCELGEGPVWDAEHGRLYWVDINEGRLHWFNPGTGDHQSTLFGFLVSALGLRRSGGLVLAGKRGFGFWDFETEHWQPVADPDPDGESDARFNDGKTDPQGRFWAGKMSQKPENSLFRLDPDGSVHRMERGLAVSNGLGWSPDQRTFYHTDSSARKIYSYRFDPATGAIENRQVFASIPETEGEGYPDGLAVDRDGCIWSARWAGGKIVRYDPTGKVIEAIPMPVQYPTSCAFGGADLDLLYITSAAVEIKPEERAGQPFAGDVFCISAGVRGLPENIFAG
jgi:sugar lactone lactonase YvrE